MAHSEPEPHQTLQIDPNIRIWVEQEMRLRIEGLEKRERLAMALLESRRAETLTVLLSLFAGMATVFVLLYLQSQDWLGAEDLERGSLLWTVAVTGLAISAVGLFVISIAKHRQLRKSAAPTHHVHSAHSAESAE